MSLHTQRRRPKVSNFHAKQRRLGLAGRRQPCLEILENRIVLSTSIPLNSSSWTELGPAPIIQTTGSTGSGFPASSGRIVALAADPTNDLVYYAAAAGGGVWKTSNGGTSWSALTDPQQTLFMGSIAIARSNSQVIYAGTGESNNSGDSYYGRGILKSTNGGTSWTLLGNAQFNRLAVSSIAISPTDPNLVYATTAGASNGLVSNFGVWKSTDGGTNWTNTTTAITTTNSYDTVVMDPTNPLVLYASIEPYSTLSPKGVYKTTNGGTSWALAGNFPQTNTVGRTTLAISQTSPNTIIASVANLNTGNVFGLYKSTDAGLTWNAQSAVPEYMNGQGWYNNYVAIDPTNANIIFATGAVNYNLNKYLVVESIDGGTNWSDVTVGTDSRAPHTDAHALAFTATGKLLLGTDGGVWRLANSTPATPLWNNLNTNLGITQFTGIAIHPTNPDIAYGGSQDNGTEKFTDALGWNMVQFGDGGFVRLDHSNTNTVYHTFFRQIGSGPFFFERSDNAGATWQTKGTGIATGDDSRFYVPYIIDPGNQSRLVLGTDHVYVSTNRADTWTAISAFNSNGWTTTATIDCLATNGSTIYVGVADAIYVTTNNGASWTRRVVTGATDGFDAIQVDPGNALIAYAVRSSFNAGSNIGHIFRTADGGVTWTNISGIGATALPDLPAHALVIDSRLPQRVLYLGNDDGVYVSRDTGATWARFGVGLPHAQVADLDFAPALDILAAGTHGRGMFEIRTLQLAVTAIAPTGAVEGTPLSGVTVATINDPGGTGLAASINWGDGNTTTGTVINDGGGIFHVTGTHTYIDAGIYALTVSVTDAQTNSGTSTASMNVAEAPLTAVAGSPINALEGAVLSNIVVATFTDANPFGTISEYFATINWNDGNTTPGVIVSNGLGGYNVLGTHSYSAGNYAILVSIGESSVVLATANVAATITDVPLTAGSLIVIAAVEGLPFSGAVATFSDADPNARVALYSATITWGDGNTTAATFTALGGGVFSVNGTHTYLNVGQGIVLSISIHDVGGASTTATAIANVADAPLTRGAPITITGTEGIALTKTVATFTDGNPFGIATDFTATITWGDGTTTSGTITTLVGGGFGVSGVHTYMQVATGLVTSVLIQDIGGASTTATGTANIVDAPLIAGTPILVSAVEGLIFTATVATFTDTNPFGTLSQFSAIINWGDGTSSAGVMVTLPGGKFGVNGTHEYDNVNSGIILSTAIADVGGATLIVGGTAIVADAPLTAGSPLSLTTTKGQSFTARVATFTDANPHGVASDFQGKINWGDGSTSIGVVVALAGGGFGVVGTHTYLKLSSNVAITTSIKDIGGATTVTFASATVNPPINVAAVEGQTFTSTVATFAAPNPDTALASDFTASIIWGDGTSSSGVIVAQGSGVFGVMGTHAYGVVAPRYNIAISISNSVSVVTTATATASVVDAPLIPGVPFTLSAIEGVYYYGLVATFTDTNPRGVATDFAAFVRWDDGSTAFGTITALVGGGFGVTSSHGFSKQGTGLPYNVLISDAGGASTTATGLANVADAPLTSGPTVTFAAMEGQPFTQAVANFTDANPAGAITDYVASISWGDGTTSAGTIVKLNDGSFTVNGTHQYPQVLPYSTSTTITSLGGSPPIHAAGFVLVADAPLTISSVPLSVTERSPFRGVVAKFVDGSSTPNILDFSAKIVWGDGVVSDATIAQSGTEFLVSGAHVYNESGSYPFQVVVADKGGSHSQFDLSLIVNNLIVPVTGGLVNAVNQPLGQVASTSNQPQFAGGSDANALVSLFAQGGAFVNPTLIGVATANANGAWSLPSGLVFANETYTITANAVDFFGNPSSPLVTLIPRMDVDSVAPRIMNVEYGARGSQLIVTLQDTGTGLNLATLQDMANYQLVPNGRRAITLSLAGLSVTPGPGANQQTAVVTLNLGPHSKLSKSIFTVRSGGISDVAGNALDGEFKDFITSGNGVAGGDMVARLNFATKTVDPLVGPIQKALRPTTIHPRGPVVAKSQATRAKLVAQR